LLPLTVLSHKGAFYLTRTGIKYPLFILSTCLNFLRQVFFYPFQTVPFRNSFVKTENMPKNIAQISKECVLFVCKIYVTIGAVQLKWAGKGISLP